MDPSSAITIARSLAARFGGHRVRAAIDSRTSLVAASNLLLGLLIVVVLLIRRQSGT